MTDISPKYPIVSARDKIVVPETLEQMANIVGGFQTSPQGLDFGKLKLQATEQRILFGDATAPLTGIGIFQGLDGSDYEFRCGDPANDYLHWDGSALTIVGSLTATSGAIGGWTINATSIYTGTEDHVGYTANAGDMTLYSDGTDASIHAKNFYIDAAGVLNCASAVIEGALTAGAGSVIDGTYLSAGTVISSKTSIAISGWTHNLVFSASSNVQVAWATGVIALSDGSTTYNITGANTGTMSAINYIYLDVDASTTVLQTTTTYSTAIGDNKILIAVAENVAANKSATFQVYGGIGGIGSLLTTANLAANCVTANLVGANEIIANTANLANLVVTDAKINTLGVAKLTAGTITSKDIVLAVSAGVGDTAIRAGKTDFTNTESGFILGLDDSDGDKAKFYIGDANEYMNWNGSDLVYTGLSRQTIKFTAPFEDLTRYVTWGTGGATIDNGLYLRATDTPNIYKRLSFTIGPGALDLFTNSSFSCLVHMRNRGTVEAGNNGNFYIGISGSLAVGDGTTMTLTNDQYGFKVLKANGIMTLYATSGDGTTEKTTNIGAISQSDNLFLVAVYTNSKIKFYLDGTLQATHETNLPETYSQNSAGAFFVNNANTAYHYDWVMNGYTYEKISGYL